MHRICRDCGGPFSWEYLKSFFNYDYCGSRCVHVCVCSCARVHACVCVSASALNAPECLIKVELLNIFVTVQHDPSLAIPIF